MVTNAEKPAPEPTRAQRRREQAEAALRIVIAGSSVGAVRRIVLYTVAAASLVLLERTDPGSLVVGTLGLIAVILLVGTDDLR